MLRFFKPSSSPPKQYSPNRVQSVQWGRASAAASGIVLLLFYISFGIVSHSLVYKLIYIFRCGCCQSRRNSVFVGTRCCQPRV